MKFIGIIPARYNSSRFPGKPLCIIANKPMIQHTYESASQWDKWSHLCVATDDQRIFDTCNSLNIPVIMTGNHHRDCIDRCAEAATILRSKNIGLEADCRYIIIQGDEPMFNPKSLNVDLTSPNVNFYTVIQDLSDLNDSSVVKLVINNKDQAIYFSRYPIPYHDKLTKRIDTKCKFNKQIGVYSMSYDILQLYNKLAKTSHLEIQEGIGLNRFIENSIPITMKHTKYDSRSVDTELDRQAVEREILEN
tara:strand:+ start:2732 stop:3478 length:747 start_codon:yes stop_codon:yes gene_type:complete